MKRLVAWSLVFMFLLVGLWGGWYSTNADSEAVEVVSIILQELNFNVNIAPVSKDMVVNANGLKSFN